MVQRQGDRLLEADFPGVHHELDQLDDDLGVGLALEMVAVALQFGLEAPVVLDDAVVDERQPVVFGVMGVGIDIARLSMRRPPGMGDADVSGQVLARRHPLQVAHLALGLVDDEVAPVADERHSGTVIAPVFEPGQPLDQDRIGLPPSDVTDDSAHKNLAFNSQKTHKDTQLSQNETRSFVLRGWKNGLYCVFLASDTKVS